MKTKSGGLILEAPKFKAFVHELAFGAAPFLEEIKPLGRDVSGIPICFQGLANSCVSCTITWIRQWLDKNKPDLAWEWLAWISATGENGSTPSSVLEPARTTGILSQQPWDAKLADLDFNEAINEAGNFKIPGYFQVNDLSKQGLYHALKTSPLAIGVRNWEGVGPHFMCAVDVTFDGQFLDCINWWDAGTQSKAIVPFEDVVVAYSFSPLLEGMVKQDIRATALTVLMAKFRFFLNSYVKKS